MGRRTGTVPGAARTAIVAVAVGIGLTLGLAGCGVFGGKSYKVPSGSMLPTLRIGSHISVQTGNSGPFAIGQIVVFHPPASADDPDNASFCADPKQGSTAGGSTAPCAVPSRTEDTAETFVKRIVGLPGDRLGIIGGLVYRNGAKESQPYILACSPSNGGTGCTYKQTITVPAGDYYLVGDNRGDSFDSRFFGPVPRAWITGRVIACSSATRYCSHG